MPCTPPDKPRSVRDKKQIVHFDVLHGKRVLQYSAVQLFSKNTFLSPSFLNEKVNFLDCAIIIDIYHTYESSTGHPNLARRKILLIAFNVVQNCVHLGVCATAL